MSDPIQKPVVVRNSLTVIGPIGAATLVTTGLATLASANIQGTAVVGTSLIVSGPVTGTSFSGVGTSLTALDASNITSGTLPIARLGTVGVADATTFLRGDNSWTTVVSAVTVATANGVSASITNQGTTPQLTFSLGAITPSSITALGNISGTNVLASVGFAGSGSLITSLNATNLASGTVPIARLGASGTPGTTTFLKGNNTWATALTAISVVTANGVSAAIATGTTTPALTFTLGAITPSSVVASGSVTGGSFIGGTGSFTTLASSGVSTLASAVITAGLTVGTTLSVTSNTTIGGTLDVTGAFTAASFSGNGTLLTALNASNLTSGIVATARLASGVASSTSYLRGDGVWAALPAFGSVTTTSVVTANGISGTVATATTTPAITLSLGDITPTSVVTGDVTASGTIFSIGGFTGPGVGLAGLNASNLASGTVGLARLGTGVPDATTFLSGTNAWTTAVTSVTIVTANGISGSIATQGTTPAITLSLGAITPTSIVASSSVTAASFIGVGTALTALNASNLSSGTIAVARLGSGTASASTYLRGDGSWSTLPVNGTVSTVSVAAANGVSGTVATANSTPVITLTLGAITPSSIAATGAISATSFSGVGTSLTALNASNLTSGNVPIAQLGTGVASTSTYLRGDGAWTTLPSFGTVTTISIASANGISGTVATPTTTPIVTLSLGAITPTSVTSSGNVGGATVSSSGLATLNSAAVTNNATVGGSLGVTGSVTAPNFIGALAGTGPYTPVLTTGVFAGVNSASPTIPQFGLIATAAPVNAKASSFYVASDGSLNWTLLLDNLSTNSSFMTVARSGTTATNITFSGTSITLNGAVSGTSFSGVGTNLTALNATNIASGIVPAARLGTGTTTSAFFLRGDNTWALVTANALQASGTANTSSAMGSSVVAGTYGATAGITWISSATAVNGKSWQMWTTPSGNLFLGTLSDDGASNTVGVTFTRSALTISDIAVTATTITLTGAVTGSSFSGIGSGLTALNASNLTSGTVATTRLGTGTSDTTTYLRGDGTWAVPTASGNISGTTVTASGLGTFGSLSVNGASTLSTLTVNSNASFSAGFTANGSASIGGSMSVSGSLTTGDITGTTFIPSSNTVPAYGVYEGVAANGVAIATGGLERLSVSAAGVIKQSGPVVSIITAVAASAVDCSKGNYFTKTYSGVLTWTFTNVPTGVFYSFILRLVRGAAGTQTWPSTVKWTGGTAPTLTTTNGGSDIMEFMTDDGGASWRAYRRTTTTT